MREEIRPLTTTITGGLGTNSYQWQQYIGTTWTNIAGATGASYTGTNLSATTNYRANLTQSISGCAASTISAITVKTFAQYHDKSRSSLPIVWVERFRLQRQAAAIIHGRPLQV